MHTIADRIALLEVWYGVRVCLAPDGRHLSVTGPGEAVDAASPMLRNRRADFVAHLRRPASVSDCTRGVERVDR